MHIRFLASAVGVLVSGLVICAEASGQTSPLTLVAENGNGTTFLEDVGVSYGLPFTASGGVAPYTYSVISGQLPGGETLSSTSGQVTGAPSAVGTSNFTVQVQDSMSSKATLAAMILVFADPAVVTTSLPAGGVGAVYSTTLVASGGYPSDQGSGFTYSWSIASGALPQGLSLAASTGVISGTPTTTGAYNFTVDVSDSSFDAQQALSITIGTQVPLQIPGGGGGAQVTLPGGTVLTPYSQILPASNGNPPYTWTVLGGGLPQGLSLASSGTLSGTPSQAGGALFTAKVTDTAGATASAVFVIAIAAQNLTITTGSALPNGIVGSDYPVQIIAVAGGMAPYAFKVTIGALPGGLVLSPAGQISGTPTAAGPFNFTVTATDSSSPALMAQAQFQITVQAMHTDLILSQTSLAFSITVGATGLPSGTIVSVRSSVASQMLSYSVDLNAPAPWLAVTGTTTPQITPGTIGINLDPSALQLQAGTMQTSILVICIPPSPCAGSRQNISVSLTVSSSPPQLSVDTSLLAFSAQTSNTQPISQTFGLQNSGGGTISGISVTAADSFVTVSGVPATLGSGPATPVTVTVSPANLKAGFRQSSISILTSAGSANVPLTLLLAQNPTMTLNPGGAQFQEAAGSTPGNPSGSFQVSVSGNSTISWTAMLPSPVPNWLTLNTTSGTSTSASPGTVNFSINANAASLAAQTYYGSIQINSSGVVDSPLTFIVVLTVAPAGSPAVPVLSKSGLLFLSSAGGTPAAQTVQVFTSSAAPVTFQASSDSSWLTVNPATGSTSTASSGSTSVSVSLSGLKTGVYRGNVSYALSGAAVRTVNVTLIVESGTGASARTNVDPTTSSNLQPRAACAPTQLVPTQTGLVNNFAQPAGYPTPLSIVLVNDCGQPVTNGQVAAQFNNGDPPLPLASTDTTTGTYSGTWTPRNTNPNISIVVSAVATGFARASVQLAGKVTPSTAPLLTPNGTVNASAVVAEPGFPIAPGTIVAIYGSNLAAQATPDGSILPLATSLDQTSVIIGGMLAPLYYVAPGQINAQVPFELTAGNQYQVFVSTNGAMSTPAPIQLTADAPGIFQAYAGQVIAQHISNSGVVTGLVTETSPAKPGEFIVFYLAGMGLTNPGVASGNVTPLASLTVLDTATLTLNGAPVPTASILFAGLTPTAVGLYQIDIQVPANAPNGDLPLVLTQTSGLTTSTILPVHN